MMDDTYANQDVNANAGTVGSTFAEGTPVFDVNGDKVGSVAENATQGDYFVVRKGLIFTHDLYIPLNAVARSDMDVVYLNVSKDQIQSQGWDQPPAAATGEMMARDTMGTTDTTTDTTAQMRGRRTGADDDEAAIPGHPTPPREGDVAMPVREEELTVNKERREAGRVRLRKDVVEERQSLNVPVTHEEVRVERVPVDEQHASDLGPDAFTEKDIDVPLMGEQVVTDKRAHVAEEVRLRKQAVTDQQRVSDTVKKERVRVEGEGIAEGDIPIDQQDTVTGFGPGGRDDETRPRDTRLP
jgi:uncharacterized protein (TIGR02271 family)